MKVIGVIPARYGSTRLEGKPLKEIAGKPMIQLVYEAAQAARLLDAIYVATDDERIVAAVEQFGGQVRMTAADHKTGTDRIAEVAAAVDAEIVVNIQGDEPLVNPAMIDEMIQPLLDEPELPMSTLCVPIQAEEELADPNAVKVVFDQNGYALYFSRSLIPYPRKRENFQAYEHLGLYAYRKAFLMTYVTLPQSRLEINESLEQLRVLEAGYRLKVVVSAHPYDGVSVDTPEDLDRVRRIVQARLISALG
ncbi:MAG TPA: 3-deoxy-manno-octulosonate cytidylyltransferase [Caldilineaceae bacterium]|nr:3-deoxy-manno-octulosonate cytidylyltransferase [Caldilineaceae bacterium]